MSAFPPFCIGSVVMPIVTCAILLAFSSTHCPSPGLQELPHMLRLAVK